MFCDLKTHTESLDSARLIARYSCGPCIGRSVPKTWGLGVGCAELNKTWELFHFVSLSICMVFKSNLLELSKRQLVFTFALFALCVSMAAVSFRHLEMNALVFVLADIPCTSWCLDPRKMNACTFLGRSAIGLFHRPSKLALFTCKRFLVWLQFPIEFCFVDFVHVFPLLCIKVANSFCTIRCFRFLIHHLPLQLRARQYMRCAKQFSSI